MSTLYEEGTNEGVRTDGVKVVRFWAAADSWDRATISVRVNYREWLHATAGVVDVIEVGNERRFRPSNPGRGMILPHVEVVIHYRDKDLSQIAVREHEPKIRTKPTYPDRQCRYCGKSFVPSGSAQRYCSEVCRRWYDLEEAEKRAANRGLNNDQGGL